MALIEFPQRQQGATPPGPIFIDSTKVISVDPQGSEPFCSVQVVSGDAPRAVLIDLPAQTVVDALNAANGGSGGGSTFELIDVAILNETNFVTDPSINPVPVLFARDEATGIVRARLTIFGAVADDSQNFSVDLDLPAVALDPAPSGGAVTVGALLPSTSQLPMDFQPGGSGEFRLRNAAPGGSGNPGAAFASVTATYVEAAPLP